MYFLRYECLREVFVYYRCQKEVFSNTFHTFIICGKYLYVVSLIWICDQVVEALSLGSKGSEFNLSVSGNFQWWKLLTNAYFIRLFCRCFTRKARKNIDNI